MMRILLLARRYIAYHRWKTLLLVLSIALPLFLPVAIHVLLDRFERELVSRSRSTPAIIGAKGSRFDLALHALYFRATPPELITMADAQAIDDSRLARAIPLSIRDSAGGFPVVATTLDYFEFRRLRIQHGQGLARLGDCVFGADAARQLKKGPGDFLLSDSENVFDLAGDYPLNMRIRGVLRRTGSSDDQAVFVELKTGWIIQGIGHGHQDLTKKTDPNLILANEKGVTVANAALPNYTEITDENIKSFHFHGDKATFPITAVIAVPDSVKSQTLLEGRYQSTTNTTQFILPENVVEELMQMVFRIKTFFDANTILVTTSTILFVILVVLLSLRLRRREMQTMFRLGCSRSTVFWIQAAELSIVTITAVLLVAAGTAIVVTFSSSIVRWLT